jgi:hypothetical protein
MLLAAISKSSPRAEQRWLLEASPILVLACRWISPYPKSMKTEPQACPSNRNHQMTTRGGPPTELLGGTNNGTHLQTPLCLSLTRLHVSVCDTDQETQDQSHSGNHLSNPVCPGCLHRLQREKTLRWPCSVELPQ